MEKKQWAAAAKITSMTFSCDRPRSRSPLHISLADGVGIIDDLFGQIHHR
jgi:hypothetical protein